MISFKLPIVELPLSGSHYRLAQQTAIQAKTASGTDQI
jgi:hypothetical protein